MEEAEETTRLRERLVWRRQWCVYGQRELITAALASEEEDGPEDSATTTEVSEGDKEYMTHTRDWRQRRRRRGIDKGPK